MIIIIYSHQSEDIEDARPVNVDKGDQESAYVVMGTSQGAPQLLQKASRGHCRVNGTKNARARHHITKGSK